MEIQLVNGDLFAGNVFEVTQYNHAHHGANNKVEIQNVKPDTLIVPSTSSLTAESTTVSLVIQLHSQHSLESQQIEVKH